MPVYEYKCAQCGRFECEQHITDHALNECPVCRTPVQRLVSRNVGVVFKGSGFYCTDNRKAAPCENLKECAKENVAAECGGCAKA
ncbi:MAG TPA: FmdB family transcriptional regulator [Clostridiales bacterium UBA8153]|nr:FmdB family transcriptional regulator [Clostridiales bacterium UBA8153]